MDDNDDEVALCHDDDDDEDRSLGLEDVIELLVDRDTDSHLDSRVGRSPLGKRLTYRI